MYVLVFPAANEVEIGVCVISYIIIELTQICPLCIEDASSLVRMLVNDGFFFPS